MNRLEVLAALQAQFPTPEAVKEQQIFCIEDGARLDSAPAWDHPFQHGDHAHDRAFIFDPRTRWEFRPDGELRHFTGGMILWRNGPSARQYCLFRRTTHPIGFYTIAAGHLEIGEKPQEAALREAYEETRLGVINVQPLYEAEEISDECRRGVNFHVWYLYLGECIGEPTLSNEGDIIGWYSEREILEDLPLTRPTGYFFARLFGQTPQNVRAR